MSKDTTILEAGDFERHGAWLRRLARSLVADDDLAEDLAQDTWLKAVENRPDRDRPLRAWLTTVARNLARFRGRSDLNRARREAAAVQDATAPSTEELVERTERHQLLGEAVLSLDEPFRETVLLHYQEGLGGKEIARLTGVPEGTARSRLKSGLDRIRERLDRRYGGDRKSWVALLVPMVRDESASGGAAFVTTVTTMSVKWALGGLLLVLLPALGWWGFSQSDSEPTSTESKVGSTGPTRRGSDSGPAEVDASPSEGADSVAALVHRQPAFAPVTGSQVVGRVVQVNGDPIAAARVELILGESFQFERIGVSGLTGADGSFVLQCPVDEGGFAVIADKKGFSSSYAVGRRGRETKLVLRPAVTLSGRVLEFDTRAPIPNALVVVGHDLFGGHAGISQWRGGELTEVRTDADGAYFVEAAPSGTLVNVTVHREGHVPHRRDITLPADPEVEFDILVPGGAAVYGRVFDVETGLALVDVAVHCSEAAMAAQTDSRGEFSIASLRGEEPWVSVSPSGYAWTIRKRRREEFPKDDLLLLPVIRATTITGLVLDADGNPVPDSIVTTDARTADATSFHQRYPAFAEADITVQGAFEGSEAATDQDGRFRLTGIPPFEALTVKTRIILDGSRTELRRTLDLSRAGQEVEVTLQPGSGGGSIVGKATLGGSAHKIAVLWSSAETKGTVWTETGEYRIDSVPSGRVQLKVYVDSGLREERTVVVTEGEVTEADFDIPDHRSIIAGVVRTPEGAPRPKVSVKPFPPGTWGTYSGADGTFRYEVPVPAGTVVRLELEEFPYTLDGGEVTTGREDITVVFPAVVEQTLHIVDADTGTALPRVRIRFHPDPEIPIVPFEEWEVVKPGPDGISKLKLPAIRLDLEFEVAGYESLILEDVAVSAQPNPAPLKVDLKKRDR